MNEQLIGDLFVEAQRHMKGHGSKEFSEIFTKLIVQECVKCCEEVADINKTYLEVRLVDPEFGPKECIEVMKKHFGVEE